MAARVLISVRPGYTRTAIVENNHLTDMIIHDDGQESLVGGIYLGRVEKVLRHLAAAFVDLGGGISGFLAAAEARPPGTNAAAELSSYLTEGQAIIVQVQRDGFEDKGPKLTTGIAINGRAMILTPGAPGVRVSRRIGDKAERDRLQSIAEDLAGENHGFIIRTAAAGIGQDELRHTAQSLHRDWADIIASADRVTAPARLSPAMIPAQHVLRDFAPADVSQIFIDDPTTLTETRAWCHDTAPELAESLSLHTGVSTLFESHDVQVSGGGEDSIEAALDEALSSSLVLPSGGSVVFSETPALVAIDVNAGGTAKGGQGQTALATNLEAVDLIARQVRLRNLSGLLVVDFVSSKKKKDQTAVQDALKRAVADDPAQVFVGGFTRFGLMEMTRRRNRPSLTSLLLQPCAPCDGQGRALSPRSLAYRALDRLAREADATPAAHIALNASPAIVEALRGPARPALVAINERFGRSFAVLADSDLTTDSFEIAQHPERPEK